MYCRQDDPEILEACVADIQAVYDRDPACEQYAQCMLHFKGFQAIQCQRVAHWMWRRGRRSLALALQSRMSEVFAGEAQATVGGWGGLWCGCLWWCGWGVRG